jgi:hypothetical protein
VLMDLVATIAAGFAGAGIALLLRRLSGGRLPGVFVPWVAGGAMIAFLLWNDYSWYGRTAGGLPEQVEVYTSMPESAAWRPWSYLAPVTERFGAVDTGSIRRNPAVPGQVMAEVYLFARRAPVARLPVLIDCVGNRRADIADGMEFAADGAVSNAVWTVLEPDDPLAGAVCADS